MSFKHNFAAGVAVLLALAATLAAAGPGFIEAERHGTGSPFGSSAAGLGLSYDGARSGPGSALTESEKAALPPLDLSDMRPWNWQGKWHASEWDHAFSDVPWRSSRIKVLENGDVAFYLDKAGAPELQAINQPAQKQGLWQTEVTLPDEASGLVIAPLWLYNQDTKDEIDFEFAGKKGLEVNIHSYPGGQHMRAPVTIPGTSGWSGRRVRFGIRADLDAGKIEMLVDGALVHTFTREENPGAFPSTALKPFISMWPAKSGLSWAESWLGKWEGEPTTMIVHGYRFSS